MNPQRIHSSSRAQTALLGIAAVGVALHAYTMAFKADGGSSLFIAALFAWSAAPYALAVALGGRVVRPAIAAAYAAAALVGDALMHHAVFIQPKGSTAALGLLFMPLWNLLLIGPAAALLAWLLLRLLANRRRASG